MSGPCREMTLGEYVEQLPETHQARRELVALRARVAELEGVARAVFELAPIHAGLHDMAAEALGDEDEGEA